MYDIEGIEKFIQKYDKSYLDEFIIRKRPSTYYHRAAFSKQTVQQAIEENSRKNYEAFHIELRTPIIAKFCDAKHFEHTTFQKNPCLKDLEFVKVIDAYNLYQRIY